MLFCNLHSEWFDPIEKGKAKWGGDFICGDCATHLEQCRMTSKGSYNFTFYQDETSPTGYSVINKRGTIKFPVYYYYKLATRSQKDKKYFSIMYEFYFYDMHGYLWTGLINRIRIPGEIRCYHCWWPMRKPVKKVNKIHMFSCEVGEKIFFYLKDGTKLPVVVKTYNKMLRCYLVDTLDGRTLRTKMEALRRT